MPCEEILGIMLLPFLQPRRNFPTTQKYDSIENHPNNAEGLIGTFFIAWYKQYRLVFVTKVRI